MTILEKELLINEPYLSLDKEKVKINGEEWDYNKLNSCDHIITPTKIYIISNIAHLLQQNIETNWVSIEKVINKMREKDEILTELIHTLSGNDLVGPWKTYQVHNEAIRYSHGETETLKRDEHGRTTIRPSWNFITRDIRNFQPINKKFSKDSEHIYRTSHQVKDSKFPESDTHPNKEKFQSLLDSNYWYDGQYVFHCSNLVKWAIIEDENYNYYGNDRMEIIKDSYNQWYSWYQKLEISHPECCVPVLENFLFDWENVYVVSGFVVHNLTKLCDLTPWANISKEDDDYKIWDKYFRYNGDINSISIMG
ncbi:MAG: hypothetical protein ACD_80C00145G0069 [uncultured bacterium (gcode 4)]|uniref:Uncharacterized protein n=1 Tax=uncultured bacterium (gcode 4) TaxID=1234023 RepID=K1X491_9BACT|nr:MAG: hypothetical protein ACD_80C00145G0069 [uncultured bacterium (gcode 4)]